MNCAELRAQLPFPSCAGEDSNLAPEIRCHLANCAQCRQEWQEISGLCKLLNTGVEPAVQVNLATLYRQAAIRQTKKIRRWRWLGLAASLLLTFAVGWSLAGRVEIRITPQEMALRWGNGPTAADVEMKPDSNLSQPAVVRDKRDEQIETLTAMVRAMVQELQTVDMQQRRDRADFDVRVSGLQEQSRTRWLALQKDLEALYVLTQKGD